MDTVASKDEAVLHKTRNTSFAVPLPCNTSLLPLWYIVCPALGPPLNLTQWVYLLLLNKYYFPTPCMIGYKIAKYCNSGIDISDGFIGDLKKIVGTRFGAKIKLNSLPTSRFMKIILKKKFLRFDEIINCGDDYELILIVPKKNSDKIQEIAYKNKIKISKIGKIIKTKGIFSEYGKSIISKNYFKHFA